MMHEEKKLSVFIPKKKLLICLGIIIIIRDIMQYALGYSFFVF